MKNNKEFDFENTSPIEVFFKFPKSRQKILDLNILKIKNKKTWKDFKPWIDNIQDKEIIIPSFKCIKTHFKDWKETRKESLWFPYYHQVFWFLLIELKDIWFAISELERISNDFFKFPNGNIVELDKRK